MRQSVLVPRAVYLASAALLLHAACGRVGYDAEKSVGRDDGAVGVDVGAVDAGADAGGLDGGSALDAGHVDAGAVDCLHALCDLWPQCGCPATEGCRSYAEGERVCTAAGSVVHGGACTGTFAADCAPGTLCIVQPGWPDGTDRCVQYCNVHADCAPLGLGSLCALAGPSSRFCTLACDPVAQTDCPAGTQCSVYNAGSLGGTNCTELGALAEGQSCATHPECGPGMMCGGTCRRVCIVGDPSPCDAGETCDGSGIMLGADELGTCV